MEKLRIVYRTLAGNVKETDHLWRFRRRWNDTLEMSLSFRLSVSLSIHPSLCRYEAVWPRISHFHVFMDFVCKYLIGLLGKGWYGGADSIDLRIGNGRRLWRGK